MSNALLNSITVCPEVQRVYSNIEYGKGVYLFDDKANTVKKAEVTTGIQDDQYIIIKTGLKAGQKIVTGPYSAIQTKLKDGMKVEETTKDKLFSTEKKK